MSRASPSPDEGSPKGPKTVEEITTLANSMADVAEEKEHPDNDESDLDDHEALGKLSIEKNRGDKMAFSVWLAEQAENATAPNAEPSQHQPDDDVSSLQHIVAKGGSDRIISNARDYQSELFERAKRENIIAVLPTGSGKTLISVLLLRHILDQELENRATGLEKKVAFFVVETVILCFQQFRVLEANIDQPVARLCGDVNYDSNSQLFWEQLFNDHKIVVCTAEILYQCLRKSYFSVDRINLMVFDEAHHCKKNHPYARIIKEFYIDCPKQSRPRLFGMSASPVDSKEEVEQAAARLETLLHCKVATLSDPSLLQQHNFGQPQEHILQYTKPPKPYLTNLASKIEAQFSHVSMISKHLASAADTASELGEWCADHLWKICLSDERAAALQSKAELHHHAKKRLQPIEVLNRELEGISQVSRVVSDYLLPLPDLKTPDVSEKVLILLEFLDRNFRESPDSRCLVFVQKRNTARLLKDLIASIGYYGIRVDVLTGAGSDSGVDEKMSIREQMLRLVKFRNGDLNLLVATSVAEEGLDVPDCNCVIRFDIYSTMIQYVQSRGRARHAQSQFITMVETGNVDHRRIIRQAGKGESLMREFCSKLPEDRLLQGNDQDLDQILIKEKYLPSYKDTDTGAQLTFYSALSCLELFVSYLPREGEATTPPPIFDMFFDARQYYCEVILPDGAPIRSVTGHSYSKKALAKRSAAFEACLALRKKGHLDNRFVPTYHKKLPAMRNAHLALNARKLDSYDMRIKPALWEKERGTLPDKLHVTTVMLGDHQIQGLTCTPIALLTRSPLLSFPTFPLFTKEDGSTDVLSETRNHILEVDESMRTLLSTFTFRVFYDLFNKKYEYKPADLTYWIAPLQNVENTMGVASYTLGEQEFAIDWETLNFVAEHEHLSWTPDTPEAALENKFLVDKWDGGRRFISERVDHTLVPDSPLPEGCAPHKWTKTILEYSVSLFGKSRHSATWNKEQPVLKAHMILHGRNWLDEWSQQRKDARTLAYLCPEPLKISAIPAPVAAMCYALPAFIHRFEEYMVAQEAMSMLGLQVRTDLALESMTKDSDNTEEHRGEQIHFQRGMGKNYERLEFIGDCFLKMATSISLFAQNANDDEFEFHVKRMIMICNKNMFNHASQRKLYEYIRSRSFSRRTWYPEGLNLLEGRGKNEKAKQHKHQLHDKSIADVCEAIIGAALLSHPNMDMAVQAVTIMVKNSDHDVQCFADYIKLYSKPAYQTAQATASQTDLAQQIYEIDDYHFKYPRLLRSAFLHSSYSFAHEHIPCYQRLEFLGDALLDMACVQWLFHRHPHRDPQWLTEHKMAMVSNKFLGALCVRLGFHRHIKHSNSQLIKSIAEYSEELNQAHLEAEEGATDYWMKARHPPKCLPDVVEAYIGALFVDSDFDYAQVERFFHTHISVFFEDMSVYDSFANAHPSTFLGQLLQKTLACNRFRILADELPTLQNGRVVAGGCGASRIVAAVLVHGKVVGSAEGSSVKYAKIRAAKQAADKLKHLDRKSFKETFGCSCKGDDAFDAEEAYGSRQPVAELVDKGMAGASAAAAAGDAANTTATAPGVTNFNKDVCETARSRTLTPAVLAESPAVAAVPALGECVAGTRASATPQHRGGKETAVKGMTQTGKPKEEICLIEFDDR